MEKPIYFRNLNFQNGDLDRPCSGVTFVNVAVVETGNPGNPEGEYVACGDNCTTKDCPNRCDKIDGSCQCIGP